MFMDTGVDTRGSADAVGHDLLIDSVAVVDVVGPDLLTEEDDDPSTHSGIRTFRLLRPRGSDRNKRGHHLHTSIYTFETQYPTRTPPPALPRKPIMGGRITPPGTSVSRPRWPPRVGGPRPHDVSRPAREVPARPTSNVRPTWREGTKARAQKIQGPRIDS